jgi:transposase
LARIVETGPDPEKDGVVRWRCADLQNLIKERWDIELSEVSIGRLLKERGFSHISPRPRHAKQEEGVIEAFKKTSAHARRRH